MWDMHPIRTEEQFDRVLQIVLAELQAEIEEVTQGPGAKFVQLTIAGHRMTLRFSSQSGITLESVDLGSSTAMQDVRAHFEALLA